MKAAVYRGLGDMRVEECQEPRTGTGGYRRRRRCGAKRHPARGAGTGGGALRSIRIFT